MRRMDIMLKNNAKRILVLMLIASLSASMLAGCGKKKKDDETVKTEENAQSGETSEIGAAAGAKPTDGGTDKSEDKAKESDTDVYMAFLEGNRKCAIKPDDDLYFDKSTEYTLDEMIKSMGEYNVENYISDEVLTVNYAFIDSGADWKPQLAVKIEFGNIEGRWVDDIQYLFFDNADGKVTYGGSVEGYYRSFVNVNEYGYIVINGSNSAASCSEVHKYFNPKGDIQFLYSDVYYLGLADARIPDLAVTDKISNDPSWPGYDYSDYDRYYVTDAITLVEYNNDIDYDDYLNQYMFRFTDPEEKNVMPEPQIGNIYSELGLECYTAKDIDNIIGKQLSKYGVTDKIKNGDDAEWLALDRLTSKEYVDYINDLYYEYEEEEEETPYYVIDNPSWEYYDADLIPVAPGDYYQLKQESVKGNDIIDVESWFNEIGVDQSRVTAVEDENYYYSIYGNYGDPFKPNYMLDITDKNTGELIATLDFSEYTYSEDYIPADYSFIDESVRYAQSKDGVLYVSIYHNTYAESAPHNAYIVALDMNNNYRVLWKTQPLTCNSNNFVVLGNMIFCGYGFTAEPDYIYQIDIETGVRTGTTKVATAADYFVLSDDASKLYVRTYNKDYVFNVILEK